MLVTTNTTFKKMESTNNIKTIQLNTLKSINYINNTFNPELLIFLNVNYC